MSHTDQLRAVLALPDDDLADAGPDPADGQPRASAADADSNADEDSTPLSPEELVAEAVRQDREANGEADEEEDPAEAAADAAGDEEDLDDIREKARLYDEQAVSGFEEAVSAAQAELDGDRATRVATAKTHYRNERKRIQADIWRDAQNSPNPDAYYATHFDPAMDRIEEQETAWLGQIDNEFQPQAETLFHLANKSPFADHLIKEFKLPEDIRIKAALMRVADINDMPAAAKKLQQKHTKKLSDDKASIQKQAEAKAKEITVNQPHPSATGKPRRQKPVNYTGSKDELKAILALR